MMVDIEEFQKVVDYCDVFAIGFRLFPERLIVDTRANAEQGPMIRIVEPLESVQARFYWLGRERPSFGPPERFMFVPWPHSLQYLEEIGILERVRDRLVQVDPQMAAACDDAFAGLRKLERAGIVEAIRGEERYRTLWSVLP
ncbi:MAG TPA: hypothetical protein VNL92_06570 [Dehalococcoidia bacterium]|nr:hypothetical protein [Dehalococcoidia bacterium]